MAQQKFTVTIDKRYNKQEREAITAKIIDHIIDRTVIKNRDKFGEKFPEYSKSYKDSLEFRIAGKSASKVDLQLSGDMLAALGEYTKSRTGKITIGYNPGSEENSKAEGNIKGTYGSTKTTKKITVKGKTKRVPRGNLKRNFLGLSDDELRKKILTKFPLEGKKADKKRQESVEEFRQLETSLDKIGESLLLQKLSDED